MLEEFINYALVKVLFSSSICGCFGGLIGHFINNEKSTIAAAHRDGRDWFVYPSIVQSSLIGAAGSIAFLFFITAIGGLNNFNTLNEYLRSISVSVIAGFGARSLLPRMVGNLEKQLSEVDTRVSQVGDKVEEVDSIAQAAAEDARKAIQQAESAKSSAEHNYKTIKEEFDTLTLNAQLIEACAAGTEPQIWKDLLNRAQELAASNKASSAIWINIARLQRHKITFDAAISTLDNLLNKYFANEISRDKNFSAAYYNRACYYEMKFLSSSQSAERQQALADVKSCLTHAKNPASEIEQMRDDKDLAELVKSAEFVALADLQAATNPG
ncbi:hypothetical protein DK419_09495 [Methylobacterium terrae]|uniref:Uncharacterized protein n=2 Tax=Methylobacterium terrae TaxID=2202827 RepID=A0A2U8WK91_9HYPH|nr:hypothetical protein DK419_09495 [Methylobacterium terrae]